MDINDDGNMEFIAASDIDKKVAQQWLKETKPSNDIKKFVTDTLKSAKGRQPTHEESDAGRDWLCRNYYDIRTFGAVLSLKSAPNCGQVRGPVQLTFGRSINQIVSQEHTITRMAVATEAEEVQQKGSNRTMGRKHTVPYGLYRAHGFVSAFIGKQTGFSEDDLELLWQALEYMFEHDRSAARGEMATRGLYVFEHDSELGNAHAHSLFERIVPKLKGGITVPRSFADYEVTVNEAELPTGVKLYRRVG